ncbi:MAG: GNAT family N-acetyltransferase [Bacilli bacterium]
MIRLACKEDLSLIMDVVCDAVIFLKEHHIPQWQNHYPNQEILVHDIQHKTLYLAFCENQLAGIANISCKADPQYDNIYEGCWLTSGPYAVVHRLAVKKEFLGQGIATELFQEAERIARAHQLVSIRIDTHRLNTPMNYLVKKLGYEYCGMIELSDHNQSDYWRLAYEKKI